MASESLFNHTGWHSVVTLAGARRAFAAEIGWPRNGGEKGAPAEKNACRSAMFSVSSQQLPFAMSRGVTPLVAAGPSRGARAERSPG